MKNSKIYEIYTKHPDTGETGWDIVFVETTRDRIESYPDFDCIISDQCGVPHSDVDLVQWYGPRGSQQEKDAIAEEIPNSPEFRYLQEADPLTAATEEFIRQHELGHDEQRSKDEWVKAGYSLKDYRNRKNRLLREKTPKEIFQDLIAPTTED